jgi:hypothetical protein
VISENLWHPKDPSLRKGIDDFVEQVTVEQFAGDCLADYAIQDDTGLYQRYAQLLVGEIKQSVDKFDAKNILLVGHPIIINAMAIILVPKHKAFLSKLRLGTAEGFCFELDAASQPKVFSV